MIARLAAIAFAFTALSAFAAELAKSPPMLASTELPKLPETIGEPVPIVVDEQPPEPIELVSRRFFANADLGVAGVSGTGKLKPSRGFGNRSILFPMPSAELDAAITTRIEFGYNFEKLPLTLTLGWEHFSTQGQAILVGYDSVAANYLDDINRLRDENRDVDNRRWTQFDRDDELPVLMRAVPSDAHRLRTRSTGHVAEGVLSYSLPGRKLGARTVVHRILAGVRYGAFFADDRAIGAGYEQSASSWFDGVGPVLGLRREAFGTSSGTGVYFDVRGGALIGQSRTRFREIDTVFNFGAPAFREQQFRSDRAVPFLSAETGISSQFWFCRWTLGLRYGQYWGAGNAGESTRDVSLFGGFLRAEIGF